MSIVAKIRTMYDKNITTPPVLDVQEFFPEAEKFVSQWESIRDEALALTKSIDDVPKLHELIDSQTRIATEGYGNWRVFIPRAYGYDIEKKYGKMPNACSATKCPRDYFTLSA